MAMFESIQRGLSEAFKKLRGRGRITEANVREGMGAVRRALLEHGEDRPQDASDRGDFHPVGIEV